MKRLFIFVLLYIFVYSAKSQEYIHPTSSLIELEYEVVDECNHPYKGEIYAFQITGLLNNHYYTFIIDSLLTNFDDISFYPASVEDWERTYTSTGGYTQTFRWEGDNYESDYIEVVVYINNSNVELDLTESIYIHADLLIPPSTHLWDDAITSVKIVTSSWIDGSFLDCSNPVQYELKDIGEGGSTTWEIIQNSSIKASGSGVNASASNISTGPFTVEFTVDFDCAALESLNFNQDFWFGVFNGGVIVTGQAAVCPNSLYTYTAQVPGGHDDDYTYSWTYPSNWTKYSQYDNVIRLQTPSNPNYGTVRVSIENNCGTSNYSGITVYPGYCGGYYMASPNPSSEFVEIDYMTDRNDVKTASEDLDIVIRLYDKMGTIKYATEIKGIEMPYQINTKSLPNGDYIINIINGKYTESLNIIVKH